MVDPAWFTSPAFARAEAERLWPRVWLLAAHESQLASHGDFVTLDVGRDPVFLVRDGARVRAFHDVCRHRGAQLMRAPRGRCERVRCRYHGWEYALDGSLSAAPGASASQVEGRPSLVPLGCEARFGFVWVAVEPDRAGSIDDWLAPVAPLLADAPVKEVALEHLVRVEVPCNWKLSSDVHNEGYHLATLHPELAGIVDTKAVKVETCGSHTHFRIPVRVEGRELVKHQIYFFPNVQLNWLEGGAPSFEMYRHLPHASDPERAFFEEIKLDAASAGRDAAPRFESIRSGERSMGKTTDADLAMLPLLQRGLGSRAAPVPRLGPLEWPIAHMHTQIARLLEKP